MHDKTTESYEIQDVWLGRFYYEIKFAFTYRAQINRQFIILRSQALQTPVSLGRIAINYAVYAVGYHYRNYASSSQLAHARFRCALAARESRAGRWRPHNRDGKNAVAVEASAGERREAARPGAQAAAG